MPTLIYYKHTKLFSKIFKLSKTDFIFYLNYCFINKWKKNIIAYSFSKVCRGFKIIKQLAKNWSLTFYFLFSTSIYTEQKKIIFQNVATSQSVDNWFAINTPYRSNASQIAEKQESISMFELFMY